MLNSLNLFIFENLRRRKSIKKESLSKNPFYLRRMKEEDLPNVLEIEQVSFPNPWHKKTFIGEILNHPISFPLVVVHGVQERVMGYIIFWHIHDEVQINNIAVHPDFRRMGIGEAVVNMVLSKVKMEGARFITLEVRPSNFAARALYNKLGFEVLGIKENYYIRPLEQAFIMGKRLSQ